MTYKDAVHYLDSFYSYEKNPARKRQFFNLEKIKILTDLFGNPQNDYPSVHVTGTKGKGSVCSILSHILKENGFKVGLYTSPHLKDVRERMKINNKDIDKKELALLVEELKKKVEKIGPPFKPSFFETYTVLAFNYFKREKIDIGIFEVGMGGRLDATNVLRPLACAVTSISYDHTKELGEELSSIAREKAGIIKKGAISVSAPQEKTVLDILKDKCKGLGSRLIVVGRDIKFKSVSYSDKKEVFDIKSPSRIYKNLEMRLLGEHQLINCAVALGLVEALNSKGFEISESSVHKGVLKTEWPGRCEIVEKRPTVILDSAHNRASALALKKTIRRNFNYTKLILILSISFNKDIKGICDELVPLARKIIITKAEKRRSAEPEYIKKFIKDKPVILSPDIRRAYDISKKIAAVDDIILATGSVYLAGEFKKIYE